MPRMGCRARARLLTVSLLLLAALVLTPRAVPAAESDWLSGHWEGHDAANANDKRVFAMDVSPVGGDGGFTATWNATGRPTGRATGKLAGNQVQLSFAATGNSVSLVRGSDGALAGAVTDKDGHQTVALVFRKSDASAATARAGCKYHALKSRGNAAGVVMEAQDGEEVVEPVLGKVKCVNGTLVRVP